MTNEELLAKLDSTNTVYNRVKRGKQFYNKYGFLMRGSVDDKTAEIFYPTDSYQTNLITAPKYMIGAQTLAAYTTEEKKFIMSSAYNGLQELVIGPSTTKDCYSKISWDTWPSPPILDQYKIILNEDGQTLSLDSVIRQIGDTNFIAGIFKGSLVNYVEEHITGFVLYGNGLSNFRAFHTEDTGPAGYDRYSFSVDYRPEESSLTLTAGYWYFFPAGTYYIWAIGKNTKTS